MTTTAPATPTTYQSEEAASNLREVAINTINTENRIGAKRAVKVFELIEGLVLRARSRPEMKSHPTQTELDSQAYVDLDRSMGHDAKSVSESAHQAIERALLDFSRGEYAILHSMRGACVFAILHS